LAFRFQDLKEQEIRCLVVSSGEKTRRKDDENSDKEFRLLKKCYKKRVEEVISMISRVPPYMPKIKTKDTHKNTN
jgi:phosphoenolpyruvate carboxylase